MKAKCSITVSRPSWGDGKKAISITISDKASGIEFFDGEMKLEDFAELLTGLSYVDIEAELRHLEYVGKQRVTENREIACPIKSYKREELEKWLKANGQEEGWLLNSRLGSQSSIKYTDTGTILRYHVTKYIELTGEETPHPKDTAPLPGERKERHHE